MPTKLNVIFAGSGAFGLPTLSAILRNGHRLVQVVSQPDRPAGRGRRLTPTPVASFAIENNLPLIRTGNINQEPLPPADVMVVIAFGQKISQELANRPRFGSINLHASLLPKYRGAAPINWAILNGETNTGNSIIRLADRMDAGAILSQSHLAIDPLETAGELHDRLALDGTNLIATTLDDLANGRASERTQDESLAMLAPKLSAKMAMDFDQSADRVARTIRGLYPWPGSRVRLVRNSDELGQFILVRARAVANLATSPVGTIAANDHVICADGAIEILELQPVGKKVMTLEAYKRGNLWPAGARLVAL